MVIFCGMHMEVMTGARRVVGCLGRQVLRDIMCVSYCSMGNLSGSPTSIIVHAVPLWTGALPAVYGE